MEIQTEEKNGRKNIAIEVEISRKDKRRLKGIISELEHKSKYLEVKANRLESDLKAKDKEIEALQKKIDKVKKTFEAIDFKKATFGSSYSLSGEDLELIRKIIRGC